MRRRNFSSSLVIGRKVIESGKVLFLFLQGVTQCSPGAKALPAGSGVGFASPFAPLFVRPRYAGTAAMLFGSPAKPESFTVVPGKRFQTVICPAVLSRTSAQIRAESFERVPACT